MVNADESHLRQLMSPMGLQNQSSEGEDSSHIITARRRNKSSLVKKAQHILTQGKMASVLKDANQVVEYSGASSTAHRKLQPVQTHGDLPLASKSHTASYLLVNKSQSKINLHKKQSTTQLLAQRMTPQGVYGGSQREGIQSKVVSKIL